MKTEHNIITPVQRLQIAAQLLAGLLADRSIEYVAPPGLVLHYADELIAASGCIVADAPEVLHEMD